MKDKFSEIENALKCCINENDDLFGCENCAFKDYKSGVYDRECKYYMLKAVLDFIYSQNKAYESLEQHISEIQNETVKVFAERLRENSKFHYDYDANLGIHYIETDIIDKLLKERFGES